MKHLWLKWAVVPVVVLLVPAVWLGVRYASDREAENRIREKYSALVRYGTIVRMIDVHEKCERHAQSASDLARLVARGRGEKPNFDTAQKIRKQCQALPYPSDQDVNWLNKNQLTVYHEMEEILIATGRFQERNQVATERIMRDALQQLIEVEARLGTIEMMWSLSGCGQSYIIDSLRNQPFRKHASWGVGVSRWPETHTRAFSAEGYDTLRDNAPREMHALYTPTRHGQCADAL